MAGQRIDVDVKQKLQLKQSSELQCKNLTLHTPYNADFDFNYTLMYAGMSFSMWEEYSYLVEETCSAF